jgi:CheY-like chemotaxis protein
MGAFGTVRKSDTKEMLREVLAKTRQLVDSQARTLLIADRDERNRHDASTLLRGGGVQATAVDSGKQVLDALRRASYDCVVLGATLRDMTALDLIKKIAESKTPIATPIVLYGVTDLGVGARSTLEKLAKTLVLKTVPTSEAAFEETTLFLHQAVNDLPSRRRHLLATTQQASSELTGKKVLIIDDDIRNIFALTGVLEQHGMSVVNAENGKKGLEKLKNEPAVDVVLMDIMMPELDGYDTIRIIRGSEEFEDLPIIAVTAKAMQGDREKCLDAGASDYVAKPVNVEYLLALLRVILTNPVGPGRRKGRHKVAA